MAGLAKILMNLASKQAIMAGQLPGTASMRRLILKRRWEALPEQERDLASNGPLWRGACIAYEAGKPAMLIIDFDAKDLSADLRQRLEQAGGLRAILGQIDPQWNKAGFVERPSVSTGIRDRRTGVTTEGGGAHLYTIVENGGDIERYVEVLFNRLVLLGFGYAVVTVAGAVLIRTLIDTSASGIGHWLSFEADAVLENDGHSDHLEHVPTARQCTVREGSRLDTRRLLDLTDDQKREFTDLKTALSAARQPEADAIKLARGAATITRLVKAGMSRDNAERHVLAATEGGRLDLDATYVFDDGRQVTGWDILADAQAFAGKNGADPLEPGYGGGRNKAIWYLKGDEAGIFIYSLAHHGQWYRLAYDAPDIIALWPRLSGTIVERMTALSEAYRHYLPVNEDAARALLCEARLPSAAVLAFLESEELSREALLNVLAAQDWAALARLRCRCGTLLDDVLAALRKDELFGPAGGPTVDWDTLFANIDAAAAALPPGTPVIQIRLGLMHVAADEAERALGAALADWPV
jgi:hypothetical protein